MEGLKHLRIAAACRMQAGGCRAPLDGRPAEGRDRLTAKLDRFA